MLCDLCELLLLSNLMFANIGCFAVEVVNRGQFKNSSPYNIGVSEKIRGRCLEKLADDVIIFWYLRILDFFFFLAEKVFNNFTSGYCLKLSNCRIRFRYIRILFGKSRVNWTIQEFEFIIRKHCNFMPIKEDGSAEKSKAPPGRANQ